jgi:endonuclease/exonuclease/phosphatase family metal-dependent hydrolase
MIILLQSILVSIKLFQLNIEEGKLYENIVSFVKKNDFDILHFQEVTGGEHNERGVEIFSVLEQQLGYVGKQSVYWRLKQDRDTYMSNATFYKASLPFVSYHEEFLKPYQELTREEMNDYTAHATSAIDVVFHFAGKNIHFINTHLVWGPTPEDKPYKLEQGKKLFEYVKRLKEPFVLSGDFNVTPDSQIVRWVSELGVNHVVKHGISNTLNPNLHRVKHLFPAGLAVDFLFTEKSLTVSDFALVDTPDLSDHLGLRVTLAV